MLLGVADHSKKSRNPVFQEKTQAFFPGIIVLISILYNTILAFVNANIQPVSVQVVMISELLIIFTAALYVVSKLKRAPDITPHLLFLTLMISLALVSMLVNNFIYVKIVRDMCIIVLFFLLGTLIDKGSLIKTFRILTGIVLIFILIEIFNPDFYVSLFNPASYYLNTRGIAPLGESGFFRNTITSDTRFSFNFLAENRTSSIFLEQVSLANFATILMIFITVFWKSLTRLEVVLFVGSILLFILTNDSRTGSALIALLWLGYFLFPILPKNSHYLIIPAIFLMLAFFYDPTITSLQSDDLKGRLGLTAFKLSDLDFMTAFAGKIDWINTTADSGYVYLIYATTILGLFIYWLYVSYIVSSQQDDIAKRFAYGVCLFIAVNLLTSWAIFTIKVAAPLWIMAGYLYNRAYILSKPKPIEFLR